MPFIPRTGRPGLLGLAARTAIVTGTATAVSDGMATRRQRRAQAEYEQAQYELAQQQAARAMTTRAPAAPVDLVAELQKLGDLKSQGLLSDAEFEAAKARLLG
ncbi:SHOCT domain-containing protein [Rhodococcus sp. TAF43]|jgi:Short C-terminal domain|uniref:SHOCT domain-containing protein n=1 Tax=unclassified Rhodococcus (in: high G+C Gram-positive bacteria) TaxID=192944 RepID=UPI0015837295|nr:SHOCT domain-containing protein [Rhodococcus sp. W8901]QKT10491.1 SHOCT domain-containing protein [Rhodococcus sp. W8901]